MPAPIGTATASIGIIDAVGGSSHFLSVTPGATPTVSSTVANNAISAATYLTNGLTYTFTPPAASAIPNVATIISPSDGNPGVFATATLDWADGGGWTDGFKLFFGTDNPPTNIVNGTDLGYVTSYDPDDMDPIPCITGR
jgi:hypothetical protein